MTRHPNCRNACTSDEDCDGTCLERARPLMMGRAVPMGEAPKVPPDTALFRSLKVERKDTNPKDAAGSQRLPLHLVPAPLMVFAAMAFAEGAGKYGAFNWRIAGARASIYYSALMRHMLKWFNGEEADPATGVPHLASAIACLGVLADVTSANTLVDDRPPRLDMGRQIEAAQAVVHKLDEMHAGLKPHHYTWKDGENT